MEVLTRPLGLDRLVARWEALGRPAQAAIPWPRERWEAAFPAHRDLLANLPGRLDRKVVGSVCANAGTSDSAAADAFLAAMIWGYGSVGYGPWRVRRQFDANAGLPGLLRAFADVVAQRGAVAAYDEMATNRVRFLGPAFGTKYLSFVPQNEKFHPALIHDAVVSRAIHNAGGPRWSPSTWRTATYGEYVQSMSCWAADLKVAPTELEWIVFGSRASGQWASPLSLQET